MPKAQNPIIDWLLNDGWQITDLSDFTQSLAETFLNAGVPVDRTRLAVRLLHPQVMGFSYTWDSEKEGVELFESAHHLRESDMYKNSPFAALFEDGAGAIRRALHDPQCPMDFPVLPDLRDEGFSDYVALPLIFSDGRRSAITIASKSLNGFSTQDLTLIYDCLPALSRIIENYALKHTASVLLETYLGKETGRQVLSGKVKRGDGQVIRAILWFSDLRQSTTLAETLPREEFLNMLNDYFDCTAGAVLDNGGEVLRYIGDAVLAIFPVGESFTCIETLQAAQNAERAIHSAFERLDILNAQLNQKHVSPIQCGIGIHVGEVMYGNIGTHARLEFSVIGSSANEAARLESMTKELQVPVVVSNQFCELHGGQWKSLGEHTLRGFKNKRELFTLMS
jgi:adenylate cyclase